MISSFPPSNFGSLPPAGVFIGVFSMDSSSECQHGRVVTVAETALGMAMVALGLQDQRPLHHGPTLQSMGSECCVEMGGAPYPMFLTVLCFKSRGTILWDVQSSITVSFSQSQIT
jgi:hypothetical protein